MRVSRWTAAMIALAATAALPGVAGAVPITYTTLSNGVLVFGSNTQTPDNEANPVGANYYRFHATAGSAITIIGRRQAGFYDMSFWVFSGLFADTNEFGATFDAGDAPNSDFADDELPPLFPGPFGDPQAIFLAPFTGDYTVAVTNFLSNAGPPNPFSLVAEGIDNAAVPEPGTLILLGSGLTGLVMRRRRRTQA
jgi:hypothetical protein